MTVSREAVKANVSERCRRLQTDKIDLLQFHWQFVSVRINSVVDIPKLTHIKYENSDYLDALRFLSEDERVGAVGLCNFDTKHLLEVVNSGIKVYTNQVQVRHYLHYYQWKNSR